MRHACDDARKGTTALAPIETQLIEQSGQAQHVEGRNGGMLDADGAPVAVTHGSDIDRLPVRRGGLHTLALQQPCGDPACLGFELRCQGFEAECRLARQQLLDALAQQRPCIALDGEVSSQVEQGSLADLAVTALVLDEAVGEAWRAVACSAGPGGADEHRCTVGPWRPGARPTTKKMALQRTTGNRPPVQLHVFTRYSESRPQAQGRYTP